MQDVAARSAFLVDEGGTVRGAWRYDSTEVPDFDELLEASRRSRSAPGSGSADGRAGEARTS